MKASAVSSVCAAAALFAAGSASAIDFVKDGRLNVRFEGDRDEDGHSDRFWAAALCREAKGNGGVYIPPFSTRRAHNPDNRRI